MTDDRAAFVCTLVGRLLAAQGVDPQAADLLLPPDGGDRWQRPTTHYAGLTATAWHDPADFPWTEQLRAAYPDIRDEALAMTRAGRFGVDRLSAHLADGAWNEFRFSTEGRPSRENLAACPRTAAAIEAIPGATEAGLAYFSAVGPHTHVTPHCGPHNARLRCQLGLVVPDGCELRVGEQTRHWDEGNVVVFDDSFEHELFNRSDETRIVLIVDVWHPELSAEQIAAIRLSTSPLVDIAYEVAHDWVRTGSVPSLVGAGSPS